jgi:CBS domain-containing protein
MDWEHIRHVPVEDDEGQLVGVVSHRALLRLIGKRAMAGGREVAIHEVMRTDPITVTPETKTLDAIAVMREKGVSCLLVTREGRLVGIVTERDFVDVTARLLEEQLRDA